MHRSKKNNLYIGEYVINYNYKMKIINKINNLFKLRRGYAIFDTLSAIFGHCSRTDSSLILFYFNFSLNILKMEYFIVDFSIYLGKKK